MDAMTLAAYHSRAADFAKDWHAQPAPVDLHGLIRRFFHPCGLTADIGCGSGREVAWLAANGYRPVGYDACDALLEQARIRYPRLRFEPGLLPRLACVADGSFDNVLCETVIMHLPREHVAPAVRRLVDILRPNGMLYLSWRVSEGGDGRDTHGRLYTAIDGALVRGALAGASVLLDEEVLSTSSGWPVRRIVARKVLAR